MSMADKLWVDYIDSLDSKDRYDAIREFNSLCVDQASSHFGDAAEYLLLINAGVVAPMPDMSIWT